MRVKFRRACVEASRSWLTRRPIARVKVKIPEHPAMSRIKNDFGA